MLGFCLGTSYSVDYIRYGCIGDGPARIGRADRVVVQHPVHAIPDRARKRTLRIDDAPGEDSLAAAAGNQQHVAPVIVGLCIYFFNNAHHIIILTNYIPANLQQVDV